MFINSPNKSQNLTWQEKKDLIQQVYGAASTQVLSHFKRTENINEEQLSLAFNQVVSQKGGHFVTKICDIGLNEATLEADAFDYTDTQQNNTSKGTFKYLAENDIHNFASIKHQYSAKDLTRKAVQGRRVNSEDELLFWLFKNAMYGICISLQNE